MVKLCYLGGREFRVLRKLRDRFVGRVLGEWKSPSEAKTPAHSKNALFRSSIRNVLSPDRDNPASGYEATGIWSTRDSILWAWRRVRECLNDWFDPIDNYKEAYALMHN